MRIKLTVIKLTVINLPVGVFERVDLLNGVDMVWDWGREWYVDVGVKLDGEAGAVMARSVNMIRWGCIHFL